jgi:hypothetical protein
MMVLRPRVASICEGIMLCSTQKVLGNSLLEGLLEMYSTSA